METVTGVAQIISYLDRSWSERCYSKAGPDRARQKESG